MQEMQQKQVQDNIFTDFSGIVEKFPPVNILSLYKNMQEPL